MELNQVEVKRRDFLKGLGVGAGTLLVPGLLRSRALGQQVTVVSLYARLAGSDRPLIQVGGFDSDSWICQGEKVELFWVTTPDVRQVALEPDLGTFAADAEGSENGLKWGSVEVQPDHHTNYFAEGLGGNFASGGTAAVRVFRNAGEQTILQIQEEVFSAERLNGDGGTRSNGDNIWLSHLTPDRFSPRLRLTDIKPIGAAAGSFGAFPFDWGVTKTDVDGQVHEFHIAPSAQYQRPFSPPGTNTTLPLAGEWEFRVARSGPPNRLVQFMVRLVCG